MQPASGVLPDRGRRGGRPPEVRYRLASGAAEGTLSTDLSGRGVTFDPVVEVAAGTEHACALLSGGAVRCWGLGPPLLFDTVPYGSALGYGHANSIGDDEAPASAGDVNVGGAVAHVDAAGFRTCAVLLTGSVRCWGRAAPFSLGYGNLNDIGDNEAPASAGDVALGGSATQVSVGGWHMCARLSSGRVRCWGRNRAGQLGYGHTRTIGDDELPAGAGDVAVQ
ncbi:MAG TPA: RCC1 domain-containing protein [Polyangiaceae bacterium]